MTFNIATDQGVIRVEGEPIQIGQFKCFEYMEDFGEWDRLTWSEYFSGMKIHSILSNDYFSPGLIKVSDLLSTTSPQELETWCRGQLQHAGILYPVNK